MKKFFSLTPNWLMYWIIAIITIVVSSVLPFYNQFSEPRYLWHDYPWYNYVKLSLIFVGCVILFNLVVTCLTAMFYLNKLLKILLLILWGIIAYVSLSTTPDITPALGNYIYVAGEFSIILIAIYLNFIKKSDKEPA